MVNQEMYVHYREEKFQSTNFFVGLFCFRFNKLEIVLVLYYFFYPFDVGDGIELRSRYTDSRIMSCKSADIDEVLIFLQN